MKSSPAGLRDQIVSRPDFRTSYGLTKSYRMTPPANNKKTVFKSLGCDSMSNISDLVWFSNFKMSLKTDSRIGLLKIRHTRVQ